MIYHIPAPSHPILISLCSRLDFKLSIIYLYMIMIPYSSLAHALVYLQLRGKTLSCDRREDISRLATVMLNPLFLGTWQRALSRRVRSSSSTQPLISLVRSGSMGFLISCKPPPPPLSLLPPSSCLHLTFPFILPIPPRFPPFRSNVYFFDHHPCICSQTRQWPKVHYLCHTFCESKTSRHARIACDSRVIFAWQRVF